MAKKREFRNRMNDLSPKDWIKFQKSWFSHNPPPRRKDVLRHPAKFPETLAQEFIEFFTKSGQMVFDPMVGTGSTLLACLRSGRNGIGLELNPAYAEIGRELIDEERELLGPSVSDLNIEVLTGDAADLQSFNLPQIDYVITSPPYWDMLHARGAETQQRRRDSSELDVTYSDDPADLGNIADYDEFLDRLVQIYTGLKSYLRPRSYLTVILKNVKKKGTIYPLAWDVARNLADVYTLKDERIWVQDNIPLAPYGMGNAWVSNIHHHYCLQFRFEP
ncbi:MAG: class I SAM-dependent methyltransferase [Chloroflexota bacterium]|nr:class I SAM-dependent methyltransferase [Chloroflexota bacterium]